MLNNTTLVGRLTKDPDLKYTQSGKAVAQFTLAVTRDFKNADGEYDADFINCVMWGKSAETLADRVKKGERISLVGRIQTRNYENNDGQRVYVTEVVANTFHFLETKGGNGGNNQQRPITDDDLPF
ncbi:single-stranded DNA-binding protein [Enterococcus cecorum]